MVSSLVFSRYPHSLGVPRARARKWDDILLSVVIHDRVGEDRVNRVVLGLSS